MQVMHVIPCVSTLTCSFQALHFFDFFFLQETLKLWNFVIFMFLFFFKHKSATNIRPKPRKASHATVPLNMVIIYAHLLANKLSHLVTFGLHFYSAVSRKGVPDTSTTAAWCETLPASPVSGRKSAQLWRSFQMSSLIFLRKSLPGRNSKE